MNRMEFMRQLELLLTDITPAEKDEAIQYYNDYFDDAGAENEIEVLNALGTPARLAESIKSDIYGKPQEEWEFTETGCLERGKKHQEVVLREEHAEEKQKDYRNAYSQSTYEQNAQGTQNGYTNYGKPAVKVKNDTGKIILLVILAILFSPVWLGLLGGLLGMAAGIIITLAVLLLAFGIVAIALVFSGIILFVWAIVKLFTAPLLGILTMGIALLLAGVGILFTLLTVWICATVLPAFLRGAVKLCRMPFERKEKGGQYA